MELKHPTLKFFENETNSTKNCKTPLSLISKILRYALEKKITQP